MIWQFNYHRGSAFLSGFIETSKDEESVAYRVAEAWCRSNTVRGPSGVRRMILADESILKNVVEPEAEPLPDASASTSAEMSFGQKIVNVFK